MTTFKLMDGRLCFDKGIATREKAEADKKRIIKQAEIDLEEAWAEADSRKSYLDDCRNMTIEEEGN